MRAVTALTLGAAIAIALAGPVAAQAPAAAPAPARPWSDRSLTPDRRAELVLAELTVDEKIGLVHGSGRMASGSNGGAGYVPGIPRLGLPALEMADAAVGVAHGAARGRYATLMPSIVAEGASWDPQVAFDYGALVGRELRDQGYNAALSGGVNLLREPRGGRGFEYRSEDPVLAGTLVAQNIRGIQSQKVIATIKHFAVNDQETGRTVLSVRMSPRDLRESDLLAFEIGVAQGQPGMVMCSYNRINGDWACENDFLLNRTLKRDWGFKGFVLSDWGGTHSSVKAALAGLDQEQPGNGFFGATLKADVAAGRVPAARLDDMVRRILRTMFASGVVDTPVVPGVVNVFANLDVAQRVAEAGAVLLKNDGILPLAKTARSVVVIGSHADAGVLTGGGSAQVDPPGGSAVATDESVQNLGAAGAFRRGPVWYPSAPLKAIRAKLPGARVTYDPGTDPAAAAAAAKGADVAIVVASQPSGESGDLKTLALPDNQDAVIAAVAAANPNTVVVLETAGAVLTPWADRVKAIAEIWFPGARGAEATADLLFGDANFTGKLPLTFPASEADLPLARIAGSELTPIVDPAGDPRRTTLPQFDVTYPEGAKVGYKWYDATGKAPRFAFGHGLSYTSFAYSALAVAHDHVTFTLRNTGARAGAEVAQVYAAIPDKGEPPRRLVGWAKVALAPGEEKTVTVPLPALHLSIFDEKAGAWTMPRGRYGIFVGGSSRDTPLTGGFVNARR